MTTHEYLVKYQPLLFQTFGNSLTNNNLSHAYLLSGDAGTPLKQTILYLAKSLVCDNPNPYACENCVACTRFDEGNYTDFYFFDGEESAIKKDSVLTIEKAFNMTSVESKGVLIYVMHNVENMTIEAINALLKFLEEPAKSVYAFLTTSNPSNVLPTIKSRSTNLSLQLIKRDKLLSLCSTLSTPREDIELLSVLYNLPSLIAEEAESERYQEYKTAVIDILTVFSENPKHGYLKAHELLPALKDRYIQRRVFNYFALFFKDVVDYKLGRPLCFPSYVNLTKKLSEVLINPVALIVATFEITTKFNDNVNIGLLIDELLILMIKETHHGK